MSNTQLVSENVNRYTELHHGNPVPREVYSFLKLLKKKPNGICALTLGEDYKTLSGTFIFDHNTKTLLNHYPGYLGKGCKVKPEYVKVNGSKLTVNFVTNLDPKIEKNTEKNIEKDVAHFPFCCKECTPVPSRYGGPRLTSIDSLFEGFRNSPSKEHGDVGFHVTTKVQYGKLLDQAVYIIRDGKRVKVPKEKYEHRKNSFKVYTCDIHNLYITVDIRLNKEYSTRHHVKAQNNTDFGPQLLKMMSDVYTFKNGGVL